MRKPALPLPPISAELWARLRRFDPHCSITMQRRAPHAGSGRIWCVSIHDERTGHWDYVIVERPRLADALLAAVEEAERRGWAR